MHVFEVDQHTLNAMDELKSVFGVRTYAQVIRKALAFARVAAEHCERVGDHFVLRILGPDEREVRVLLNG